MLLFWTLFLATQSSYVADYAKSQTELEVKANALAHRCDEAETEEMARLLAKEVSDLVEGQSYHWTFKRTLAAAGAALARHGALDEAWKTLTKAHTLPDSSGRYGLESATIDDHLGAIAEMQGRWIAALEIRLRWQPLSFCGNCSLVLQREKAAAIARCLVKLGRKDEARYWIRLGRAHRMLLDTESGEAVSIGRWHPHW